MSDPAIFGLPPDPHLYASWASAAVLEVRAPVAPVEGPSSAVVEAPAAVVDTVTPGVAPGRALALALPPVPVEPVAWPGGVPGVLPGADPAAVAARYLGDASLAPLLTPVQGGFQAPPGALTPTWRAAYDGAVRAQVAWSARAVAEATGDPAAAQAALLEGLRALPDPDAQARLLEAAGRTLAGALAPDGPGALGVLKAALAAEAQRGPLSAPTLTAARDALLEWMEDGSPEASARVAALLVESPAPVQAALLRAVAEAHDTPSVGPFARFGEPTPGHMLHRLMEGMVPEDRARALDALEGSGVLTEAGAARLRAGRSTAGRLAPWLTHGAHLATEDYARWSQEEGGGPYALAGGLAVLGTEPLVADTVLTLGSAGAGPWAAKLLAARFPLTATALGAAGTGLAAYQATVDLQAVLTGQDPYTGKPLGPGETLARVVRAGSGVLLTATGMIAAFQAGKIGPPPRDAVGGPRQATAADLADLTTHYAPVDVPGLPPGMQVWVPRRLPVVVRAPVPPGAPAPAPVAVGPVGALAEAARLGLPAPPKTPQLAPGAVAAAEVEQEAASLAGNVAGELMKPHRFGADEGAVQAALRQSARETAQTTYLTGRTQGMTPKQARNAALRAARDALGPEVARHAEATALRELETRVADGRVFDRAIMDPRARAVLEAFERGQIGAGAKAWAVRLAGKSERQVRALMKLEVQAGRATERAVALTAPKAQTMSVWEMPDGTVVRVKPLGDAGRAGPTLSVEVKVDPGIPDANQSGIAFKLDARGRPVPKNMNEANQPFAVHGDQGAVYNRACMDLGHQSIKP